MNGWQRGVLIAGVIAGVTCLVFPINLWGKPQFVMAYQRLSGFDLERMLLVLLAVAGSTTLLMWMVADGARALTWMQRVVVAAYCLFLVEMTLHPFSPDGSRVALLYSGLRMSLRLTLGPLLFTLLPVGYLFAAGKQNRDAGSRIILLLSGVGIAILLYARFIWLQVTGSSRDPGPSSALPEQLIIVIAVAGAVLATVLARYREKRRMNDRT